MSVTGIQYKMSTTDLSTIIAAIPDYFSGLTTSGQTITHNTIVDNEATNVDAINVTGAGTLLYVSQFAGAAIGATKFTVTIDGTVKINDQSLNPQAQGDSVTVFPLMLKFGTSCRVQCRMAASGGVTMSFGAGVVYA